MHPHTAHQPAWGDDPMGLCSTSECKNDAMHDWGSAILCCAHDEFINLTMRIEQLQEDRDEWKYLAKSRFTRV
jgi:hypothetical protein